MIWEFAPSNPCNTTHIIVSDGEKFEQLIVDSDKEMIAYLYMTEDLLIKLLVVFILYTCSYLL